MYNTNTYFSNCHQTKNFDSAEPTWFLHGLTIKLVLLLQFLKEWNDFLIYAFWVRVLKMAVQLYYSWFSTHILCYCDKTWDQITSF